MLAKIRSRKDKTFELYIPENLIVSAISRFVDFFLLFYLFNINIIISQIWNTTKFTYLERIINITGISYYGCIEIGE